MKCPSCDQPMDSGHEEIEHGNLCCDCFDETVGMPAASRSRPRLKPLATPYIDCELVGGVHDAATCKTCAKRKVTDGLRKEALQRLRDRRERQPESGSSDFCGGCGKHKSECGCGESWPTPLPEGYDPETFEK